MRESIGYVPLEERKANSPASYINIKGKDTNPDAWPIQIRNGVISLDFGAGCLGCSWCITKRQKGRDVSQDMPYRNHLSADNMLSLLQQTKAFTQAKLPLRIGNNTDGTLIPIKDLDAFYKAIPKNVPVSLLTRGIHSPELNSFLATTEENFVLCRSITPPHKNLNYKVNLDLALKGFKDAICQKVLNIGPLVKETFSDALTILKAGKIDPGTRIIIAPLNRRLMPDHVLSSIPAQPITSDQIEMLENAAKDNDLIVYRANNCAVADFNGKPSLEYGDINSNINYGNHFGSETIGTSNNRGLKSTCPHCGNKDNCVNHHQSEKSGAKKTLDELTKSLGISNLKLIYQEPGVMIVQAPDLTKSETSYMSGILETRVIGINSLAQPNQQAIGRWMQSEFYPAEGIADISESFDPLKFAKQRI